MTTHLVNGPGGLGEFTSLGAEPPTLFEYTTRNVLALDSGAVALLFCEMASHILIKTAVDVGTIADPELALGMVSPLSEIMRIVGGDIAPKIILAHPIDEEE